MLTQFSCLLVENSHKAPPPANEPTATVILDQSSAHYYLVAAWNYIHSTKRGNNIVTAAS